MMKGIISMILGALLITAIIIGAIYLLFSGILFWLLGIIAVGMILIVAILFIFVFVFVFLLIFAFFYYFAEKKPTLSSGNYTLDMEKGKNEDS